MNLQFHLFFLLKADFGCNDICDVLLYILEEYINKIMRVITYLHPNQAA